MMRILLTGFPPFPGRPVNPSQALVEAVQHGRLNLPNVEFVTALLPVEYGRVESELGVLIEQHQPDAVLSFGVGRQKTPVRLEQRGVNLDHGELPDNAGEIRLDHPIDPAGPSEVHSPLDLESLRDWLSGEGHGVEVSRDAGQYVCNHLVYTGLRQVARCERSVEFLFTHLAPADQEVSVEQNLAALDGIVRWFLIRNKTLASVSLNS